MCPVGCPAVTDMTTTMTGVCGRQNIRTLTMMNVRGKMENRLKYKYLFDHESLNSRFLNHYANGGQPQHHGSFR